MSDLALSRRECVWLRQRFQRETPGSVRLDEGFPLPGWYGSCKKDRYVPAALQTMIERGLATTPHRIEQEPRFYFTRLGIDAIRATFGHPKGLKREECPALAQAVGRAARRTIIR
ncbi:hypothetical protein AA0535_2266 [Asaia krungthepensis NRIC 0535]|uniref:Uncharacterized protein n=1 Tax=Asaia krungthepensis NRIC 0535 TaxID=1307925 RepID=A0ABQ0Q4Q9_9PROT|nr:hypothetical protein AA0535_2266 [Asaia krungthepensis NRIC 0535]